MRHFLTRTAFCLQSRQVTRDKELKEIFVKQCGICPYTGRNLTLGKDASLDHIVAKSKGSR